MAEERANSFLRLIRSARRGRLKIYLGYCAGVGKTYKMLEEAHQLKGEGIDVVVGLAETHGRPETENLLKGLEIIPRRRQDYHGITVEEMDGDAIQARKPQVVLVDELAHTNVPGSANPKRFQDVQDILEAGIHVISTLNIQHLESLYDTVEKATGVKVRERLPDSALAEADQIVNVDLATEDLRKRLEEGKVYTQERVETALDHFFKSSNLENLRELTLRELASQIDLRRREFPHDDGEAAPDQVMVCLSSRGPNSDRLLRYGSRLAGKLNRNWYAVYVQTPSEEPTAVDAGVLNIVSSILTLAKQLGAMVFTYKGEDVADTILRFAREYRVGHIVLGRPRPLSLWQKLRRKKNIINCLVEQAHGVSITVLDTREGLSHSAPATLAAPLRTPQEIRFPEPMRAPSLGRMLTRGRIVIWDRPVKQQEVIRALVEAAWKETGIGSVDSLYGAVMERESQGSTFFNEGCAFPHVRIAGINGSLIALGLTKQGVTDVSTEKLIEIVFLILSPLELPDAQVQALALASRAVQNRHLLQSLRRARTTREALEEIWDWEREFMVKSS
jgi:two-component system sensor histidine kinase KdpD